MENFETLSDDQLRLRLQQYGFANLPVTDTTRKVLVKKLKLAVEGQKTKNRRETVAVTKFSSDEEPEVVEKTSKRDKTPNRRATVAVVAKKTSSTTITNGAATNGNSRAETPSKTTTSRRASRATPLKENPPKILQEDSDDDVIEIPVARRSRTTTPTLGKSDTVRTSYKTNVDVVEENIAEEVEEEKPRKPTPVLTQTTTRRKTFTTSTSGYSSKLPEPAATTSKFGRATMTTSYNPRGNYNFNQQEDTEEDDDALELDETNAPYLSNFAKRLSTLRAEPLDAGLEKYRSMQTEPSTSYKPSSQTFGASYQSKYSSSAPLVARKSGFWKDIGQIYDSLDRKYNFRTILYIIFIVMIIVAIYVIFM